MALIEVAKSNRDKKEETRKAVEEEKLKREAEEKEEKKQKEGEKEKERRLNLQMRKAQRLQEILEDLAAEEEQLEEEKAILMKSVENLKKGRGQQEKKKEVERRK